MVINILIIAISYKRNNIVMITCQNWISFPRRTYSHRPPSSWRRPAQGGGVWRKCRVRAARARRCRSPRLGRKPRTAPWGGGSPLFPGHRGRTRSHSATPGISLSGRMAPSAISNRKHNINFDIISSVSEALVCLWVGCEKKIENSWDISLLVSNLFGS